MNRHELLSRISTDPAICFGRPCIRGHRIWVSLVLDLLADGWTVQQLLEQYPGIKDADVLACIAYGAERSRERHADVPLLPREDGRAGPIRGPGIDNRR